MKIFFISSLRQSFRRLCPLVHNINRCYIPPVYNKLGMEERKRVGYKNGLLQLELDANCPLPPIRLIIQDKDETLLGGAEFQEITTVSCMHVVNLDERCDKFGCGGKLDLNVGHQPLFQPLDIQHHGVTFKELKGRVGGCSPAIMECYVQGYVRKGAIIILLS